MGAKVGRIRADRRSTAKSWEAVGAGWLARRGHVTGFTFYSEHKEKPLERCKQGRDLLFSKIILICV